LVSTRLNAIQTFRRLVNKTENSSYDIIVMVVDKVLIPSGQNHAALHSWNNTLPTIFPRMDLADFGPMLLC